jgi:hypothetical protein
MKIALIKCAGSLNVGNEFINAGGGFVMRQTFPNATFYEFEAYDSCIPQGYKYPSRALLPHDADFIEGECDIMVVMSGSIFSKFTSALLSDLSKINIRKVLIGAGAYQYDDYDRKLCSKIAKKYDVIFTRDDVTFSYFNGANNVYSGIDLGFFASDTLAMSSGKGLYAVTNIDLIGDNFEENLRNQKELSKKYKTCYVAENTTSVYRDIKGFIYSGHWDTLFRLFYGAQFVVTNRIHTSVACIMGKTPFRYEGHDEGGITGRNTLFNKFGITLAKGNNYSLKDIEEAQVLIVSEKKRFLKLVESILL